MTVFVYDDSFDGLLTAVFDAYARKAFPDMLVAAGHPLPLFCDEVVQVTADSVKAGRVWRGLARKLSVSALRCLAESWLAEEDETPMLLFRYIRKAVDSPRSIEADFGDADVLALTRMWKRLHGECLRLVQFVRFQQTADGIYFAAVKPRQNALPLTIEHFKDRFADQKWLIYDVGRGYGYFYNLDQVQEVSFTDEDGHLRMPDVRLDPQLLAPDEQLFQQLWKTYFKAICIRERLNSRKHRQDMPVRYWKYLTEKQP